MSTRSLLAGGVVEPRALMAPLRGKSPATGRVGGGGRPLLGAPVACVPAPTAAPTPVRPGVRPGVEVFVEHPPAVVRGKRVGLITNQSGIDRQRRSTIDLLRAMPDLTLAALYSPEHGIRGTADTRVASSTDEQTGLPIHSLYGDTNKPPPEMLAGI